MRSLIRRVHRAAVEVESEIIGQINQGLVVCVGIYVNDLEDDLYWMSKKILGLRVFDDDAHKMSYSLLDKQFDLLIISQFTLFGSLKKGFRPSFNRAAPPEFAHEKYHQFIKIIKDQFSGHVATGEFGKDMQISSIDDGPISLWLDSRNKSY
jgi:D-tyrosyl-tRNA(Tyr) deacylase